MSRWGLRRRARLIVWSAAVAALVWFVAPLVLREVAFFRVRRIELLGVQHLAPDAVIAALRLGADATVFQDAALLADRVKGIGGVVDARVERHLPAALTVVVREAEPVAFVPGRRGGGLAVLDGSGRALPFDPARSGLDLPLAPEADAGVAAVLGLIRSVDPALFREIATARATARGDVIVELESARVVLRRDAGPEDIRAVVLVAQDLAARARRYDELDARYADQIVVRRATRQAPRGAAGSGR